MINDKEEENKTLMFSALNSMCYVFMELETF